MFRFSHLSDVHLPIPAGVTACALFNKRSLGYLSWRAKRSRLHLATVSEALLRDLQTQPYDHHCVTGDLTNLALPAEFEASAAWLHRLASPERISLVPGNHDAMVRGGREHLSRHWQPWLPEALPYMQCRGPVAFIGLSTAIPTLPFMAYGALGKAQLQAFEVLLQQAEAEKLIRVVLLHHPPQPHAATWRKGLMDAPACRAVLARAGAELVLHGHLHHPVRATLNGPDGARIPVFGVGSASLEEAGVRSGHYYDLTLEGRNLLVQSRVWSRRVNGFTAGAAETVLLPG